MNSQSSPHVKPWYTPFWFMLAVMVLCTVEDLIVFDVMVDSQTSNLPGAALFMLFLWPSLLLLEVIFYRVVCKRIKERKWVWAHLILTLFAFALLRLLLLLVLLITHYIYHFDLAYSLIEQIQFYIFWTGAIIGHIFFIVVIIQCFSPDKPRLPNDGNDLLNEIAV